MITINAETAEAAEDAEKTTSAAAGSGLISDLDRQRRLRGGEARDRNPVRRRAHVIEPHLLEEMNRRRVAAVLTANTELQVFPRLPPSFDGL